jgi:hypothetical protein
MIVRIIRKGKPDINLKMRGRHTVGHVMMRARRHLDVGEHEALFMFTPSGECYPVSKSLSSLTQPIVFNIVKENAFGALSRMFVKANIKAHNSIFIVRITYSCYGLYHFDEISTHETLTESKEHVLKQRCGGHLIVE